MDNPLVGTSDGGRGVTGTSNSGEGVFGSSNSGIGVTGLVPVDSTGIGVTGSGGKTGVIGMGRNFGVSGEGNTAGIFGLSGIGYGGEFEGELAPIWLRPSDIQGSPTSGTHQVGELYVDNQGVLYFCAATGTPGTWKKSDAGRSVIIGQLV